jgi:hypothetical protein
MLPHEGLFPVMSSRVTADANSSPAPNLGTRLLARIRWFSLDTRLIAGQDPSGSPLLAAHAARLTAPSSREQLAQALQGVLALAEQPARISRVGLDRSALLANEQAMRSLARRLESRAPVHARGAARLRRLVTDSASPIFTGGAAALAHELDAAEAELDGGASPSSRSASSSQISPGGRFARRRSAREVARLSRRRSGPGSPVYPPGFTGGSFSLPDGSWFHGRRDAG